MAVIRLAHGDVALFYLLPFMFIVSFFRTALRPLFLAGFILSAVAALAQSPSAIDGFDPNVDGNVYAMATQPDGKIIVAGQFSLFRPAIGAAVTRNNIARINLDGSVDPTFDPNVGTSAIGGSGTVRTVVLQQDGKILIGGDFTAVGGTVRNRVARLNTDGTLDAFNPNIVALSPTDTNPFLTLTDRITPQVNAIAVQPNGKVVVGGRFAIDRGNLIGRNIARFNVDGTPDSTYNPNPNAVVFALVCQLTPADFTGPNRTATGDGRIIAAGGFTTMEYHPGDPADPTTGNKAPTTQRNRVVRINANGSVDSEFDPNVNNVVNTLVLQRDGKIVLGGAFTTLSPLHNSAPGDPNATIPQLSTRNRVARLNADGTLDSEWYPNIGGTVISVALAPDGGIMVGGYFTSVWGKGAATTGRSYAARIAPDGSIDTTFNAGANYAVAAFAFQPDGKIVLGGYFTALQSKGLPSSVTRNRLARVNTDGSLDATLALGTEGRPLVTLQLPDGKFMIGGSFTSVGGLTRSYIARLNADGSVDPTFAPEAFNGRVLAIARQSDGRFIIGGAFNLIGTTSRNYVARVDDKGVLDTNFNPNPNSLVGAIAVQSDGKILIAGSFTTLQPNPTSTTSVLTNRGYIARLNTDGTLDTTFDPGANSTISTLVVQGDGKIMIGGSFTAFTPNAGTSTTSQSYIARLTSAGLVDTAFRPIINARVASLVVQEDGKVVAGGAFTSWLPVGFTDSTTQAVVRNRMARFNTDGTLDTAFDPNVINGTVLGVAYKASDKSFYIGGDFNGIFSKGDTTWTLRKYAAHINADGTLDKAFDFDINETNGSRVDSVAVQADGKAIFGGNFTSVQPALPKGGGRVAVNHYFRANTDGSLDATFAPGVGGAAGVQISAITLQNDGKIVVAGTFSDIGGTRTSNIARFNAEGTADTTFSSSLDASGPVTAVAHRPDTSPVATQGTGLAYLNTDGSLRTSFAPVHITGQILAVAVQPDGNILLGGAFTDPDTAVIKNLLRISPAGAIDNSFAPSPDGEVTSIVVQPDGKILVGGSFTGIVNTTRNYIARINKDGTIDTAFNPNASGRVNAIVLQSDGKVVIGGSFTTVQPTGTTTAATRNYIARINGDGTLDTGYNPNPSALVNALMLESDGRIIAGGAFTAFTPNSTSTATARNYIARINTDGTLDAFDPAASGVVNALARYIDGKIIVGGAFNGFSPNSLGLNTVRNFIARLNTDGTVDSNFNPNPNASVSSVAVQADGKVLFGGTFTDVQSNNADGVTQAPETTVRNYLARAAFDGTLDTSFNPDSNGAVTVVAIGSPVGAVDGGIIVGGSISTVRPNGVMFVGGNFSTIGGLASANLALVNDDGTVSGAFQPQPNNAVNALVTTPDGKTLVGGAFTTISGVTRNHLARYGSDNSLETGFAPNINGTVNVIASYSDGRSLVGGTFTTANGAARVNLARLLNDGSTDTAFTAAGLGVVKAVVLQGDGRILVLSDGPDANSRSVVSRRNADGTADTSFAAFNGGAAVINAIALQADGRVLVGGAMSGFVRRLNANGTVDATFDPQPDGAVSAITLQTDGKTILAGSFGKVGGLVRAGLARLAASSVAAQGFSINAARTVVTYTRSGTASDVAGVSFARSDDGITWTPLGPGARATASAAWQITVPVQPATANFYIRARSVTSNAGGTSSGLTETIRELNAANVIAIEVNPPAGAPTGTTPGDGSSPTGGVPPVSAPAVAGFRVLPDIVSLNQAVAAAAAATTIGTANLPHLSNLSTRARVASDNVLLTGFAINGSGERTVLVRAVGPGLTGFGVSGALAAPLLRLYDSAGNVLVENSGWAGAAALAQAATMTGAFPLTQGSADAALLVTLAPGTYTIQVTDSNGNTGGVALAEVYDVAGGSASRLANVSSRTSTSAADGTLISGFVVAGTDNENLLIRGVGPALTQFGVSGAITDPKVGIYNSAGTMIASNDNWSQVAVDTDALAAKAQSVGAFALSVGSKDAAISVSLAPGAYTAQVTAASGNAGGALLEIYELK